MGTWTKLNVEIGPWKDNSCVIGVKKSKKNTLTLFIYQKAYTCT